MTNEWQPIETAPKDGVDIIIFGGEFESAGSNKIPMIVKWNGTYWTSTHYCYNEAIALNPTHWMPLPKPPEKLNNN